MSEDVKYCQEEHYSSNNQEDVAGSEPGYFLQLFEEGDLVEIFVDVGEDGGGQGFEICCHGINLLKNNAEI